VGQAGVPETGRARGRVDFAAARAVTGGPRGTRKAGRQNDAEVFEKFPKTGGGKQVF